MAGPDLAFWRAGKLAAWVRHLDGSELRGDHGAQWRPPVIDHY